MKLPRILAATAVASALCVASTLALSGQAAYAADNDPVQTIFFGRELLAFQCGLHGGTFYQTGSGYGCHLAGGGDVYCEAGTCTWTPARMVSVPGGYTVVGGTRVVAVAPFTPPPVTVAADVPQVQLMRAGS